MAKPTPHLSKILDNCVEQIQKGDFTLADCLERYPEHRDELSGLLPLALDIGEMPRLELSQAEIQQGRGQLLTQLPTRSQPRRWSWPFRSLVPARRFGMAWLLIVIDAHNEIPVHETSLE